MRELLQGCLSLFLRGGVPALSEGQQHLLEQACFAVSERSVHAKMTRFDTVAHERGCNSGNFERVLFEEHPVARTVRRHHEHVFLQRHELVIAEFSRPREFGARQAHAARCREHVVGRLVVGYQRVHRMGRHRGARWRSSFSRCGR